MQAERTALSRLEIERNWAGGNAGIGEGSLSHAQQRHRSSSLQRTPPKTIITVLNNTEVAGKLLEIRTLMEMSGESFYKYMAFEKAAASVENASPLPGLIASRGTP